MSIEKPATVAFWVDLLNPTPEEIARVSEKCGLQVPTREALQEIETSSRLRCDGQALYLSMPLAVHEGAAGVQPVPLGFIFPSPRVGVRAQIQLLKSYAVKKPHYANPLVDKRLHGHSKKPAVFRYGLGFTNAIMRTWLR